MEVVKEKFAIPSAVLKEFFNVDKIVEVTPFGNGHINETYLVYFESCRYIVQKINYHVFDNPFAVMNNMELITSYIRKNVIYSGRDPRECVLTIIQTRYGQNMALVNDEYWRCVRFIEEGTTYDEAPNTEIFEEAGKAVGEFQKLLEGFHTRLLVDTIKHFHDTPYRYEHFLDVIKIDRLRRTTICRKEIRYITEHEKKLSVITDLLEDEIIPRRVTHNDTKLNNIMISKVTGKALGLIDLDTVMKGSLLYDYGDALRIGASTAAEDETDLSKVKVNFEMFEAFSRGYLKASKGIITTEEIKHLIDGFFLMTFEVGLRFLTDFIDGDQYFVLKPKEQKNRPFLNLERAKCQLKLASEIEKNEEKLKQILNNILTENEFGITL